jgi:hypothetical protein
MMVPARIRFDLACVDERREAIGVEFVENRAFGVGPRHAIRALELATRAAPGKEIRMVESFGGKAPVNTYRASRRNVDDDMSDRSPVMQTEHTMRVMMTAIGDTSQVCFELGE